MEIVVESGAAAKQAGACVVVGICSDGILSAAAEALDERSGGYLREIIKGGDMDGERGQLQWLYQVPGVAAERVLLVGCGKEAPLRPADYTSLCDQVARALQASGAHEACSYLADLEVAERDPAWKMQQATLASRAAVYRFDEYKSKSVTPRKPLTKITLMLSTEDDLGKARKSARQAEAIANGIALAKDLSNRPANICHPDHLAKQAHKLAGEYPSLDVTVLEEEDMRHLKMDSLLCVSQGSRRPAKLIVMEYRGGGKGEGERPVVLVGKAVTFDTGGISLKPGASMDEMKFDMCGGASVYGALAACAEMQLPGYVVGIVPAVENMPDGNATRPGDIYTSMSGQTIEVLNTDAEGRLILCDALTYAERYNPLAVIDIATLTGACVIALGKHAAAVYSNHQALADQLLQAGSAIGDRCWQMPLWDEYQQQLDSNFADIANIGGREGGSITAACFLSRFTAKYHWAHLDIAGVAWRSGKDKGATGRPVSLLMQYLIDASQRP